MTAEYSHRTSNLFLDSSANPRQEGEGLWCQNLMSKNEKNGNHPVDPPEKTQTGASGSS